MRDTGCPASRIRIPYPVIFMEKSLRLTVPSMLIAGLLAGFILLEAACRPEPPETLPLPTRICVSTRHHEQVIPHATVYVKYFATVFPGYHQPASFYDASFQTGPDGRGCLEPVPEGRHWLVAFGYDSLHSPPEVYGSMPVDISLNGRAVVDTILYVSE
jgi:hypothetical protein